MSLDLDNSKPFVRENIRRVGRKVEYSESKKEGAAAGNECAEGWLVGPQKAATVCLIPCLILIHNNT